MRTPACPHRAWEAPDRRPSTPLTAVEAASGQQVHVVVQAGANDRVSALEHALAQLLPPSVGGLWLGEVPLNGADELGSTDVRAGAVLGLGGPLPQHAVDLSRTAPFQLQVVGGPGAGTVIPLPLGDTGLGRDLLAVASLPGGAEAAASHGSHRLALDDRRALRLHVGRAGVVATPVEAELRRDGRLLTGPTAVGAAELLAAGEVLLAVVIPAPGDAAVASDGLSLVVNRPPRLRPKAAVITVELPATPVVPEPKRLQVVPLVLPVVLGIVMAVLSSPLFLLFTLLSPALALSGWLSERRSCRSAAHLSAVAHNDAMAAAAERIARLVVQERRWRRTDAPDPVTVLHAATGPGRRLWERRWDDKDALLLRVGTGPQPAAAVRLSAPAGQPTPPPPELADVPVVVPLRECGVVGLAGPSTTARALGRWLVAQSAVLHAPRDLRVVLLIDPAAPDPEDDWGWLRWLPHAAATDGAMLVGVEPDGLAARIGELTELVSARVAMVRDVRAPSEARSPSDVIVVLDGASGLRTRPGMSALLRDGPAVGVHAICLDERESLLPEECRAVVVLTGPARLTVAVDGEAPRHEVRADLVTAVWADQVARGLAPLRDSGSGSDQLSTELPDACRLLDLLGLDPPTPDAVLRAWARTGGRSTAAAVGVDATGPFSLDLQRDGPHALVAGTTGSGKSEFLQTLVTSLAAANRPDALTFVLVDYKGGAAFKDCAQLPHTVGVVTDLDGHLVERALASLTAELTSRELLLAQVGAKDLEDYWSAGAPAGPLPRLVIVIDEFASLVEELPDFVRGLVGIAQRGRSLGVHLVLATQRPSGVVSPEIRANTNLRIALRVTDRSESLDIVDASDAAAIARATPGRAYARTGHTTLTCFQAARVGGRRPASLDPIPPPVQAVERPWARLGEPMTHAVVADPSPDEATDLHALVEAVRSAAKVLDLPPPRSPWLEPLPATLALTAVAGSGSLGGLRLPYGLVDLPASQARKAAVLDLDAGGHLLVAGAPRSGRTTVLRTLAGALSSVPVGDCHLYAFDCGNGALQPLADLPHCGAVVTRSQVERADRLLSRLLTEVGRRQDLLAEHGFADLREQRAAALHKPDPLSGRTKEPAQQPLPYLLLLLDRWEGFTAAFDDVDAGRMTDTVLRLLKEGPSVGLRAVVTGDRSVLLGKLAGVAEDVLCLRLADRTDYALAGLSPRTLPTTIPDGRGFQGTTGREVQVALLDGDASGPGQTTALAALAARAALAEGAEPGRSRPLRVDVLPTRIPSAQLNALPAIRSPGPLRALVGIGGDELAGQVVDLAVIGPGFTVAGPPRSGRSTALLSMALSLLDGGSSLCVLTPRPSPLRELACRPGVMAVLTSSDPEPAAAVQAIESRSGPVVVVVDDAELLLTAAIADLLALVLRDGRDRGHALVLAGTTDDLANAFRGFTADARRSRSGLLLTPTSHLHGDLLGVRLSRSAAFAGPAGRGLLVTNGAVLQVQVPAG